jgi:hypothetical protein
MFVDRIVAGIHAVSMAATFRPFVRGSRVCIPAKKGHDFDPKEHSDSD